MADEVITREVLTITHQNVTEQDRALGKEFNRVAAKALFWAEFYLDQGPDKHRVTIIREMLKSTAKLSALESKDEVTHIRAELMSHLTAMSELDPAIVDAEVVE